MDSDDLHDEAERLARAHPHAMTWGEPDRHTSQWMPQHAVPRHRKPEPLTASQRALIERRVQAAIDAIDRELDPQRQAPSKVFGNLLNAEERTLAWLQWQSDPWPGVQDWFALNFQDAYSDPNRYTYVGDPAVVDFHDDVNFSALERRMVDKMNRLALSYRSSTPSWFGYDLAAPKPAKQRKPKTYVAPGRKQGKTWIARLNQSKEATNARNRNR